MRLFRIFTAAVSVIIPAFGLAACRHLNSQLPQVDNLPPANVQSAVDMPQRVEFTTTDGVTIVADWYPVPGAAKAALLVHMLPATRQSYAGLAAKLNSAGISALAIDLRGHGDSIYGQDGQKLDFNLFSDAEHQAGIADLAVALAWLKSQGFNVESVDLVGASIGANLSLQLAAKNPEIQKIVLLSPGLDYHGVQTEPAISRLAETVQVLLISSEGDEYSADSVRRLGQLRPSAVVKILPGASHGTDLLEDYPDLSDQIIEFIK